MKRRYNRHYLSLPECIERLNQGHKITCADGCHWFPIATRNGDGFNHLDRRTFNALLNRGLIQFSATQFPNCGTWEAKPSSY